MNRILLIARREFMAYVRTVGFWLSLLALPIFAALGGALPLLAMNAEPTRLVAVTEAPQDPTLRATVVELLTRGETERAGELLAAAAIPEGGVAASQEIQRIVEAEGLEAGRARLAQVAPGAAQGFRAPRQRLQIVEAPAELAAAPTDQLDTVAARLLSQETEIEGQPLSAVVLLSRAQDQPTARVWSAKPSDDTVQNAVTRALRDLNRADRLTALGVDPAAVDAIDAYRPEVALLSPRSASGGEVSFRDRLPAIVGFASGFLLWSLIITGASILLNSVMEEKSNKILEVLLSSASASEILAGKVLGVAALTLTVLVVWGGIGGLSLAAGFPDVALDLWSILSRDGLIWLFLVFMAGGYLMYAVVFAAIGAFCETPRDAQTLMGPIMMLLVVPILAMQFALRTPDALFVKVLSWIPLFTPFLMSARIPSGGVPATEIALSMAGMFAMAALMVWLAGRAFRAGALSDVKLSWKTLASVVRG